MDTNTILTIGAAVGGSALFQEVVRRLMSAYESKVKAEQARDAAETEEEINARKKLEEAQESILTELRMRVTTLEASFASLNSKYIQTLMEATRCQALLEALRGKKEAQDEAATDTRK